MATFRTLQGDIVVTMNPAEIKEVLGSPAGPVIRYLLVLGERVRIRAKELAPRRTGKLASMILKRVVSLDGFAAVVVGVDGGAVKYALWMELGTPPHVISPKNVPSLIFFSRKYGRVIVLPVGQSVNHPGTKPYRYLTRALEAI